MSTISAGNTTTTAITVTGDTTGNLVFTTGGANTAALTLSNTQAATFANNVTISGSLTGNTAFSNAAVFSGATSGTIAVIANSTAGTNTLTLPAATGTLGMILLSSQTASSSATIDFTAINNTLFNSYLLQIDNVIPATNGVYLLLRYSVGGVFQTTDYQANTFRWTTAGSGISGNQFGTGATAIAIVSTSDTQANAATAPTGQGGGSFTVNIYNCAQTATAKRMTWIGGYYGSQYLAITGSGAYIPATNAVDGFRLFYNSGNISTGTFTLYGII